MATTTASDAVQSPKPGGVPTHGRITFVGADGVSVLSARIDRPACQPKAYALFAHCFTCGKDIKAAARIAEGLNQRGIAVLRFDFTGLGGSEGDFANTDFSSNVADLLAAANWLREHVEAPKILIGHSLGGAAVLAAASRIDEVKAIATIAAPASPAHVVQLFCDARDEIEKTGVAEVRIGNRTFRIRKEFLEDIDAHRLEESIADLRKALLVLHGPRDQIVGIDNATRIFVNAKHPKSFVSLDDADHLISRPEDSAYVAAVIAGWAERYVGTDGPAATGQTDITAPPNAVVVSETRRGKFDQVVVVGDRHRLIADEPVAYGGLDTGPGPYDYLLAGLGSCTTMTLRMYADRKSLPLTRASVTLAHDKVHAEDCLHCETKEGKLDRITREIRLEGPLEPAQRQKLLEIADKCPVHRTLHSEVWIDTRLMEDG